MRQNKKLAAVLALSVSLMGLGTMVAEAHRVPACDNQNPPPGNKHCQPGHEDDNGDDDNGDHDLDIDIDLLKVRKIVKKILVHVIDELRDYDGIDIEVELDSIIDAEIDVYVGADLDEVHKLRAAVRRIVHRALALLPDYGSGIAVELEVELDSIIDASLEAEGYVGGADLPRLPRVRQLVKGLARQVLGQLPHYGSGVLVEAEAEIDAIIDAAVGADASIGGSSLPSPGQLKTMVLGLVTNVVSEAYEHIPAAEVAADVAAAIDATLDAGPYSATAGLAGTASAVASSAVESVLDVEANLMSTVGFLF